MTKIAIPLMASVLAVAIAASQPATGSIFRSAQDPQKGQNYEKPLSEEVEEQIVLFQFEQKDRMTLPIALAGLGQFDFMVDTGAERSAISSEAAERLGLRHVADKTVISFAGITVVPAVITPSIALHDGGGETMEMLTFGKRAIGADGVLGLDSLGDKTVTFDFADRKMKIRDSGKGKIRAGNREVAVDLVEKQGRMVISSAKIRDVHVDMIIDTGSAVSVGNMALRRELKERGLVEGLQAGVMLTFTGQLVPTEVGIVRNVDVDGFTIGRMPVAFVESPTFAHLGYEDIPVLYFGMEAMRAFDQMQIDFANRRALFRARDVPGFNSRSTWWLEAEQRRQQQAPSPVSNE